MSVTPPPPGTQAGPQGPAAPSPAPAPPSPPPEAAPVPPPQPLTTQFPPPPPPPWTTRAAVSGPPDLPPRPPIGGAPDQPVARGPHGPLPPETRGPLRREAAWGWRFGLAGLVVGLGPELLLYVVSLGVTTSSGASVTVTTASAVALIAISLVVYGWDTAAAWFFSVRVAGRRLSAWGFRLPTVAYFWTIPTALAVVYAVSVLHDMVVHPRQQDIIGEFPHTTVGVVLFVLLAVIIAPLFEEIFFRGFLFRALASSWGWLPGAAVSAAVFGIAHAQPDVFIPLFTLGLVLAWVYKRTGSLWTSISLHALFNGISVLAWALSR